MSSSEPKNPSAHRRKISRSLPPSSSVQLSLSNHGVWVHDCIFPETRWGSLVDHRRTSLVEPPCAPSENPGLSLTRSENRDLSLTNVRASTPADPHLKGTFLNEFDDWLAKRRQSIFSCSGAGTQATGFAAIALSTSQDHSEHYTTTQTTFVETKSCKSASPTIATPLSESVAGSEAILKTTLETAVEKLQAISETMETMLDIQKTTLERVKAKETLEASMSLTLETKLDIFTNKISELVERDVDLREADMGRMMTTATFKADMEDMKGLLRDVEDHTKAAIIEVKAELVRVGKPVGKVSDVSAEIQVKNIDEKLEQNMAMMKKPVAKADVGQKDMKGLLRDVEATIIKAVTEAVSPLNSELMRVGKSVEKISDVSAEMQVRNIDEKLEQIMAKMKKIETHIRKANSEPVNTLKADLVPAENPGENIVDVFKQLKCIERRQNVQVNLHDGEVQLLKPIKFQPIKLQKGADPPPAEFKDASLAEAIVNDIADILRLFPVKTDITGHTGNIKDQELAKDIAHARAELVKKQLVDKGITGALLMIGDPPDDASGKDASEAKSPSVTIKMDIFPEF